MVVERVLQGRSVAVGDVHRSHQGPETDQNNLTPGNRDVITLTIQSSVTRLGNFSTKVAQTWANLWDYFENVSHAVNEVGHRALRSEWVFSAEALLYLYLSRYGWISVFLNGPIPASFCLFSSFSKRHKSNINWLKRWWCAWDSNPGWQDGRHTRIHWAIAAPWMNKCYQIMQ